MLGLGDSHGDAAMEWTLQNVNKSFEVTENGGKVSVSAFTDGKLVDFGTGFGRKKAYRFNFPDQHTLPRTLRVPSVSTRLCFDSGAATMLLAGLKAVNMLFFLKTKPVRRAAIRVAGLIRWGQDSYALKVDAWGKKDERDVYVECFLNGSNEADMTGKVAAFVAEMLYVVTDLPRGVFHIDQVMTPTNIKPLLRKRAFVEIRVNGNIMA
jgi:saccharopine dehydrogenase-like NADP-dependent oxidoreductase